jgi:anti-anti-sigma regulatory factor
LDIRNVPHFDSTAVSVLMEMLEDYAHRSIVVCFVKLKERNKQLFQSSGLIDTVGSDKFFSKTIDALNYVEQSLDSTSASWKKQHNIESLI